MEIIFVCLLKRKNINIERFFTSTNSVTSFASRMFHFVSDLFFPPTFFVENFIFFQYFLMLWNFLGILIINHLGKNEILLAGGKNFHFTFFQNRFDESLLLFIGRNASIEATHIKSKSLACKFLQKYLCFLTSSYLWTKIETNCIISPKLIQGK